VIDHLDHLVLTTHDEQACIAFYVGLLGMTLETFGEGRKAFKFGGQKINVHVKGREYEPKAHLPVPGALDLCGALHPAFVVLCGVEIIEGPVRRTGADYPLRSIYLRDSDLNLIEIAEKAEA